MASTIFLALKALQITPDKYSCHHDISKNQVKTEGKSCDAENLKPTFSRDTVSHHCTHDSCWIVINNKVYDVTRFLRRHPGGEDIILEHGGCDASAVFIDKGHSSNAYDSLAEYLIGEITLEDWWPEKAIP